MDPVEIKIKKKDIWVIQTVNVCAYIFQMFMSFTSNKWGKNKIRDVSKQWVVAIKPIGWGLAIWAVIYLFVAIYVLYMALPTNWVPSRNNDLIFG